MKPLPIYYVYLTTKDCALGMQPIKARNQKHAKEKFKKRFPKSRFMSASRATNPPLILSTQAF